MSGGWTNHAGGYLGCSHIGCTKKANPTITGHECCGRCTPGRDCLRDAQASYDGPGGFAHSYAGTLLYPDECSACGEPREAHPVTYNFRTGERH